MKIVVALMLMLTATACILHAQQTVVHSLTFTQGTYQLTLTAPPLASNVSGTILSTATGWALGGNALVGAGPSTNKLGSTDGVDVELIAGGAPNVRLLLSSAENATALPAQGALRFTEATANGTDYVGIQGPDAATASYTIKLPSALPTANQVLRATNGTSPIVLEWASVSGGSGWAQGGNAVTGAGNDNVLGTTTAFPLRLAAGAVTNVRLEVLYNVAAVRLPSQTALRLGDGGSNHVGLQAPAAVGTSYTVSLPAAAPTTGQVLRATSATATEWATPVVREVVNVDPASVPANGAIDLVLTTTNTINVNDLVYVTAPGLTDTIILHKVRRTGANQITARLTKPSGGAQDDPAQDFIVHIVRVP